MRNVQNIQGVLRTEKKVRQRYVKFNCMGSIDPVLQRLG